MENLSLSRSQSWLGWFFRGALALFFFVLVARLVELQVIKGSHFRKLAEGNRIRRISITAPRGKILARGGEVIVSSKEIKKRIEFNPEKGYEKKDDLKNAAPDEIITEWQRQYMLGQNAGHVTGYLGEATEDEVGKINPDCSEKGAIELGQLMGRTGLEEEYECILSGIDGEELVEVDSSGNKVRTLGRKSPQPGKDLKTSISIDLQKKVAEAMKEKKGAAIVTDVHGEILALYSSPSFDPNLFVSAKNSKEISELLNDNDKPFFNRAIAGTFHPGSVVKPVVAIAALEEGEIDKDYIFNDEGKITIESSYGTFTYNNWYFTQYGGVEGDIKLTKAIARSTDTFFYKVGELLGVDRLADWYHKFDYGEKTGIDLPGEVAGLVPTPEWKKNIKGESWFLGNTYHMAIGQGDVALSPIEINTATSAVASGGKLCSPRIATDTDCKDLGINKDYIALVREGMIGACSAGGTGYSFFDFAPQVACKTGTAETGINDKTHAWFTVFAPSDFPEVVATVLVEEGGEGSQVAGPIATEIFKYWFLGEENKTVQNE